MLEGSLINIDREEKMTLIQADFLAYLENNPRETVQAIVSTTGSITDHKAELEAAGLNIVHCYSLIPSATVLGEAQNLLALSQQDWVQRIEPDTHLNI